MSITYFYRDTFSDLEGTPSTIGNFDATRDTGVSSSQINTGNLNSGITASCFFFTVAGDPGTDGTSTGEFTVELRIDIQNANIGIRVHLVRVNSSGTEQSAQIEAAEGSQTAGAATRQYNWTNPDLGSWASGDRLGVRVQFTNISGLMNQSCRLGANLETDTIITPFTAGAPEPNDGTAAFTVTTAMAATGSAPSDGPTGVIATPVSSTQIDLSWDEFDGALGYSIERDDVVIASDVQDLFYEDTGLEPDTEYKYRVGAEVLA